MMNTRPAIIMLLVIAAMAMLLAISSKRLVATQDRRQTAVTLLQSTTADAQEVMDLRSQQQQIAHAEQPENDLIARVNRTLERAGLGGENLGGLRKEANSAITSRSGEETAEYHKQSFRLNLKSLSPAELGRFLAAWHKTQPLWTVTRIELTHQRGRRETGDKYNATIVLTAVYVADS